MKVFNDLKTRSVAATYATAGYQLGTLGRMGPGFFPCAIKLLQVPYRYLFPSAMFFIVVGVFTTQNDLFQTWEVLVFGILGALFMALDFPMVSAPK